MLLVVDGLVDEGEAVSLFYGHDPETGEGFRFAVGPLTARRLLKALQGRGEVRVEVQPCQVVGWARSR
ncbi:MAG: hypothetical protein FJW79_10900 [Actinobacteria bacterium]|nr:hypothetical protein [Actinomycetota bacterium]